MNDKQSMQGTVTDVSEANGWYTVELADGKKLSTKIRDIATAAHRLKGKPANIAYTVKENTKDGKTYRNLYIGGIEEEAGVAISTAAPSVSAAPASNRDDSIIRQTVIKAACDLLSGTGATNAQVIAWCDVLYGWVTGKTEEVKSQPAEVVSSGPLLDDEDLPF